MSRGRGLEIGLGERPGGPVSAEKHGKPSRKEEEQKGKEKGLACDEKDEKVNCSRCVRLAIVFV
jgi:hypothetical protein